MACSTACRPAAAVLPTAIGAESAPTPARRKLDRQGSRSRRCCGHAHRSRAAARARRAGGHSPSRNPCRRRGVARRRARRRRDPAERSPRRTGRRHRAGRHRHRRGLHGRHRRHDDLRLGARTRRPGDRRRDRWRRPHAGAPLGLPAPRPPRAGPADRACADRHRRHHDAADRVHARDLRRIAAGSARQGLGLAARRPHHRTDLPAVDRVGRGPHRRRQRRLAGRWLRDRGGARHRRRTRPAAVDAEPGGDGAVDDRRGVSRCCARRSPLRLPLPH